MKKRILILLALLLFASYGYSATVSRPYSFTNATASDADEVNSNENTLYTLVNGNIDADNIDETDDYAWTGDNSFAGASDFNGATTIDELTIDGTWTATGQNCTDLGTVTTADINGGTIDGITLGTNSPVTSAVITTADINGGTIDATTIGATTPAAGTFTSITATDISSDAIPPIGSIIPFYDFDGDATFDSDYWAYCDGSTKTLTGGIGSKTLPDLSGRYLVGFGTDGGTDIDSAAWATAAVGNASHQIDVSHTHTTDISSFTSGSESSHTHGGGSLSFQVTDNDSGYIGFYQSNGNLAFRLTHKSENLSGIGAEAVAYFTYTTSPWQDVWTIANSSSGSTAAGSSHSHSVNPPNTTSSSSLSSTQSIQPRSIRVRYIMRIR